MPVNNLNPALRSEVAKWKYNGEDLGFVADTVITEGMACAVVVSLTGIPHLRASNVQGEEVVIAAGNYAIGDIAKIRETGCVGANVSGRCQFPLASGTRMMSDGAGALMVHANGNYCAGYTLWPAQEANHRVAFEVRHFYR